MTNELQRVARAIMEAKGGCIVKDWVVEARDNPNVELAVKQAQAAIAALKDAGTVIVPVEPTEAMTEAFWENLPSPYDLDRERHETAADCLRAVIRAGNNHDQ
jgi:hypothetical protein